MEFGPYQIIGARGDDEPRSGTEITLWLDTNVAIDIEQFYFGSKKLDKKLIPHLKDLLFAFPWNGTRRVDIDIIFGLACAEVSWQRIGPHNDTAVRSLRYANDLVTLWTPDQIEFAFSHRRPPIDRDKHWPPPLSVTVGGPPRYKHPMMHLATSYGYMLHLLYLDQTRSRWSGRLGNDPIWPVRETYRWARDALGTLSGYENYLTVSLFLDPGPRMNAARKLLKIGNANLTPDVRADNAWGAAWDVCFLRTIDGTTYGMTPLPDTQGGAPTHLVSRDTDTLALRRGAEVAAVITNPAVAPIVYVQNKYSENVQEIDALRELFSTAEDDLARASRDSDQLFAQQLDAIAALEERMGVQNSTVASYRAAI